MKYNYTLGVHNSSVQKKINSKQFELSEELMDKRFDLSLNIHEMAEVIGIPLNHYAKLEFGDQTVSIDDYQSALRKIKNYSKEKKLDLITNLIEEEISKKKTEENININCGHLRTQMALLGIFPNPFLHMKRKPVFM